ncbi:SDR family oxidoreductase [Bacillus sp. 165]|uniref:SDR family oxidoreductase n=1 Tax=Bacillus sp. 165 TaxID=1529117 RepID=UPI001ADCD1B6|nr:SDR family oxidoreductase [Bacillus sp. 165]MBO9129484.1 SDR family oxidoreductase [Bacillus sp. 165]
MNHISMVTGATGGMGLETAKALALDGGTVVVVGRNDEKGKKAVKKIIEVTGNQNIIFMKADLSSMQEVKELADAFQRLFPKLDILVNNVGVSLSTRNETAEGLEKTFAINHLASFLLTNLLLESLRASGKARVINIASTLHKHGRLDMEDLQFKQRKYSGFRAYNQSKLCNILFTYELARRVEEDGITVNTVCPGWVNTQLGNDRTLTAKLLRIPVKLFAKPVERGAETAIYLALSPEVENITGKYFVDKKPQASSSDSYNSSLQQQLWQKSSELVGSVCGNRIT